MQFDKFLGLVERLTGCYADWDDNGRMHIVMRGYRLPVSLLVVSLALLAGWMLTGCAAGVPMQPSGDLPPSTRGVPVGVVPDTAPAGRQEFGEAQLWFVNEEHGDMRAIDYPVVVCANKSNGNNSDAFLGRVLKVDAHPEYGGRYFWFEATPGGSVGFWHLTVGGCRYGRITFPALENQQTNVLVCLSGAGGAHIWLWHVEREPGFSCDYAGHLVLGEVLQ